jgi:hypothetical protein
MAKQPRGENGGVLYHVASRGNLGQPLFFETPDRRTYIYFLHFAPGTMNYHRLGETIAVLFTLKKKNNTPMVSEE